MLETIAALVIFLFPLAYSPGPGNLFFAANGARFGFRATVPANAGYHLATWVVTVGIGFGFLAVMERFPQVFDLLRIAGSFYVLWIAWKMLRSSVLRDVGAASPASFADGALLLVLNPKAYVIMALMFTQFLDGSRAGQLVVVLVITTIFTLNNLVAFSLWALMGDAIAAGFRSEDSARKLNAVFGIVLAGVAVWMLLS